MKRSLPAVLGIVLLAVVAVVFVRQSDGGSGPRLGPKGGSDLAPSDMDRVLVDSVAPDFSLRALSGDVVTLSDSRGSENVVLVFYRGHW